MKSKRPKKIHITLDYDCPNCDLEFEIGYNTVNKIGKTICIYCSELITFDKISIGMRNAKPEKVAVRSKNKSRQEIKGPKYEKSVKSVLRSLGYSAGDCKNIWGDFAKTIHSQEQEEEVIDRLMKYI